MTPPSPPPTRQPPALTAGEIAALRQPSTVAAYLSFVPPDPSVWQVNYKVVAQVDLPTGWPGGTVNYTNVPIKNKSANWDSIINYSNSGKGLLVYIGSTPGGHEIGVFRTRKWVVSTGYIYIAEVGPGDPGMLPISLALASIANNHYVTVFNVSPIWPALTRIDISGGPPGVFYKDYDRAWAGETVWGPWSLNVGPHRAGFVDPVTGKFRVTFTPQITYPTYPGTLWGETVSNNVPVGKGADNNPIQYIWTVTGATIVGGGNYTDTLRIVDTPVAAAAITLDYPPGFYVLKLDVQYTVVTVPNALAGIIVVGQVLDLTAIRYVWAHDGVLGVGAPVFPAIPISAINSDNATTETRSMEIQLNDTVWSNYQRGTLVQYWEQALWGGLPVPSATTAFTGFVLEAHDATNEGGTKQSVVSIIGLGGMLDRVPASSNRLDDPNNYTSSVTPTIFAANWQQWVQPSLEQFIHYLIAYHCMNALTLFDYNWMDEYDGRTGGLNWYFPVVGLQVSAGSLWSQLKNICHRFNTEIGTDSAGALWLRPDPDMLPYSDRTTVAGGSPAWITVSNRDTIDASIYSKIEWPEYVLTKVHKVNGSAFYWSGAPPTPQKALLAVWPGGSMGYGNTEEQLTDLIVYDQTHLNQVVGNRAAILNNPMAGVRITIPGNRMVYEPANWSFITVTVPAYLDPNNVGFTRRFIIKGVNRRLDLATGTVDIELTGDFETTGQPGVTVPLTGIIIPPPPPPPGNSCSLQPDASLTASGCMTFVQNSATQWTLTATGPCPGLACNDRELGASFPCGTYHTFTFTPTGFTYEACGVFPGGASLRPGTEPAGWTGNIPTTVTNPFTDATYGLNGRCMSSFYFRSATDFSVVVTVNPQVSC